MLNISQIKDTLKKSFYNQFDLIEKRPNLYQVFVPLYHADGDMYDIFIRINQETNELVLTDCALTITRLSYTFDINSDKRLKTFKKSVLSSGAQFNEATGELIVYATLGQLFNRIMQFTQLISQVISLKILQRKSTASLFQANVDKFVQQSLQQFHPIVDFTPVESDKDIRVNYMFKATGKPVFLFPVNTSSNTKNAIITIQYLHNAKIPFIGALLHENYSNLNKTDQKFSMKVADKQFYDYQDFADNASEYLQRTLA